jgi:hypothetical protein
MNPNDVDRTMGIVEDALRTMPLSPVPSALRTRVMKIIRSRGAAPKFDFPWLEAAISLMLSTLLTGMMSLLLSLPPSVLLRAQQAVQVFFLQPANRPLIAAAVVGTVMLAICFFLSARLFLRRTSAGGKLVPAR